MIFVTVGTHEQSFERLVREMDRLVEDGVIKEEVLIQRGFTDYIPVYCKSERLFPYIQMEEYTQKARIVITHGGPSSFIMPLRYGKIPVVVPRQKRYQEHINDHQVDFSEHLSGKRNNIIVVKNIEELGHVIQNYDGIIQKMNSYMDSNTENFCDRLEQLIENLY